MDDEDLLWEDHTLSYAWIKECIHLGRLVVKGRMDFRKVTKDNLLDMVPEQYVEPDEL